MIRNQWYAVLDSKEIKKGRLVGALRFGENLVFWRDSNKNVHCIHSRCAHRGANLAIGKIINEHVQCPFHGLEYDSTGRCVFIPANGKSATVPENFKVKSYPAEDAYGFIWIWWGKDREKLPPIRFFEDLKKGFTYAQFDDHWTVHYSRAVENQLDVSHLPFVHHNTIGRGNRTVVNGPKTLLEDDILRFWTKNEKDIGQTPLKPQEFDVTKTQAMLEFIFPNLWQLRLGKSNRVSIAFVPIDENNTKIYLRFYHKIKIPVFKQLVGTIANFFNKIVLRQDKRVVLTQRPIKTSYRMDENLFQADLPIIMYRKRREELLKKELTEKE